MAASVDNNKAGITAMAHRELPTIVRFSPWVLLCPLLAQAQPTFTEDDLLGDIPVVNAVSQFEQRLEQAPASVTIISRDLIAMSGAQNFVDIFRLVPGFQAYHVGNNRYGISYHGIGREFPNQIEVMVDGRSVYETLFSSVNWSTLGIGLSDIDHIEVVRGSNAAAQGSNAFMGAINIVTRKPVQDSGLALEVTGGDLQTRNGGLRYSDHFGAVDYRVALGYESNSGFPAVAEGPLEDDRELAYGNFRAVYTPTLLDTLDVSMGYSRDRIGWGDADHPDEFTPARSISSFQSLNWQHTLNRDHELQLHLYHNKFRTTNFDHQGPLYGLLGIDGDTAAYLTAITPAPAAVVDQFADSTGLPTAAAAALLEVLTTPIYGGFGRLASERYDLEFQHDFRLSDTVRGSWGLGGRYDGLDAYHPQGYSDEIDENSYRLFAHSEWQAAPRLILNGGAMVEHTHVGTLLSPRFSANYQLAPRHALRTAYARGNRAPSLLEANERSVAQVGEVIFDILRIADPDLHEEKVTSYELAYMYQGSTSGLSLDLRLFNEKITQVIDEVQEPVPPEVAVFGDRNLKRLENHGFWQFTGGELQFGYRITDGTLVRLHYTHTDFDSEVLIQRVPTLLVLDKNDRVARHSGGILLHQALGRGWSVSLSTYHQSGLRWEDGNSIDAFTRVDAQLAYYFDLQGVAGSLRLAAQNLGSTYSEFNDNNLFQTRYFLTLQLELPH